MKTTAPIIALPAAFADHAPRVCVSYNRKSTSKGLDQPFNSIDAQEKRAEEHAGKHTNWRFAGHYSDGGKSGRTLNRPGFRRLLADAQAGKFNTIIVYKMDRLARNLFAFAKIEELFKPLGIRFEFVTEKYDDNPDGDFRKHLNMALAQYELAKTTQRTKDKLESTRKQGIWVGGLLPLGYNREKHRLIVNRLEAPIVRDMCALYLEHRSAGTVARVLREKGYTTKERKWKEGTRRAQQWTKSAVLAVLRNPVYAGFVGHGETLYEGEHEAIITREVFDEVQSILRQNAIDCEDHGENPDYFLRGVLRCASTTNDGTPCGHGFAPGSTRKDGREFRYYRCVGREKLGRDVCPCKSLPAGAIETFVTEQLRAAASNPEFMNRLRASVIAVRDFGARVATYRARLAKEDAELSAEGARVVESLQRTEGAARAIYEPQITAIGEKLTQARKRIVWLDQSADRLKRAETDGEWMIEQLSRFSEAWPLLSSVNRGRLVDAVVDEIHVNETANTIDVVFAPFGRDLPSVTELDEADTQALGAVPEPLRVTVREPLFRARGRSVAFNNKAPVVRLPVRRAAKVAHMLALAHHIERAIHEGRFKDRATVARYLEMTRARITYLMQLTLLAPDIQETILYLYSLDGVEPLAERALRPIVRAGTWSRQRELWARTIAPLLGAKGGE